MGQCLGLCESAARKALYLVRAMSIAAACPPQLLPFDEPRQRFADPAGQVCAPNVFGSHFEQLLAFPEFERQRLRHGVGQRSSRTIAFRIAVWSNPRFAGEERAVLLKEIAETGFHSRILRGQFVGRVLDDCFVVFLFLKHLEEPENGAPFGNDVHSAVGIVFDLADDFSGATDLRGGLALGEDHAEFEILLQTTGDHQFVAGLEDMQRERHAREENEIERK